MQDRYLTYLIRWNIFLTVLSLGLLVTTIHCEMKKPETIIAPIVTEEQDNNLPENLKEIVDVKLDKINVK